MLWARAFFFLWLALSRSFHLFHSFNKMHLIAVCHFFHSHIFILLNTIDDRFRMNVFGTHSWKCNSHSRVSQFCLLFKSHNAIQITKRSHYNYTITKSISSIANATEKSILLLFFFFIYKKCKEKWSNSLCSKITLLGFLCTFARFLCVSLCVYRFGERITKRKKKQQPRNTITDFRLICSKERCHIQWNNTHNKINTFGIYHSC